ncbi:MAG: immunoglobulin domain-containing protein [Candidatus Didemnitutus sp.]|nr:immunoglobulin domain-containing protein [Candidatus Didemnitutus sp.]
MKLSALSQRRIHWLNLPSAILMMLLQRAPTVALAVADEIVATPALGNVLRSAFAVAATLGTVNSVVGATPLVPSSGTATGISVATGASVNVFYTVNGTQTPPMSWSVSGNFPPGLNFSGLTSDGSVNVTTLQLSGTPTLAGSYSVRIFAYEFANEGGISSPAYNYTITVTGGSTSTAPSFTIQPASQTVTAGAAVTFTAAASGNPTPTFQWRKDGNNLAGATNATFTIASAAAGDAGGYTVVATNSAGSATSNSATLTVNAANAAPVITTQPSGQPNIPPGSSIVLSVRATGVPAPTYQWRKDGNAIAGATNQDLAINNVTANDAGSYTVVVTNSVGSVTSDAAVLTVAAAASAPAITTQPADRSSVIGGSVTFTVVATGNPTPTFQWRKDGNNLAGATTASFTIASVAAGDAGTYTVVATNSAGTATSNGATLTITATDVAPEITSSPSGQIATLGSSVTFTVTATGSPAPTFQWRKDGNNIAGATNASFTIASVTLNDVGHYSATATNSLGTVVSGSATLTVSTTASRHLNDVTVTSGHGTTLSAGSVTGSVKWQISTNGGSTWTDLADGGSYSGVTTATLAIANVGTSLSGAQYRFVASNGGVVSTSNGATLTVASVFFPFPTGIGVDGSGNLFVADANADTVQKINSSNQVSLLAGTANSAGTTDGSGSAARFNQPNGVVVLSNGGLVVADTANATLRAIDANGAVTTLAGASGSRGGADGTGTAATFSAPVGVTRDSSGVLFVADSMNHTIRRVTSGGAVTTFAGSAGAQGTADGTGAAARFNLPNGVAVDANGVVFVADTTNNTIRRIGTDGTASTLAGLAGVSGFDNGTGIAALFNRPMALVVDGSGNLFVADTGNSTIRKVTAAGVVTTFAGTAGIAGIADGAGADALFNQPQALAVDSAGNLYVADTGNAAIRKITLAGVVTTLTLTAAPAPTPTPTPTPAPAPAPNPSTGGGGGGGGGAPSVWLPLSATLLLALRQRRRSRLARRE